MLSKLMRLFTDPSTLIRTRVVDPRTADSEGVGEIGIGLNPTEAFTVKKGALSIDTPMAAKGDVVCGPRLSANDWRFSTLSLNPDPVLDVYISKG